MQTHTHPVSGKVIVGTRLMPGDTIQHGDVYDSTSGGWDELSWPVGKAIQDGCQTIWVRPAPENPA